MTHLWATPTTKERYYDRHDHLTLDGQAVADYLRRHRDEPWPDWFDRWVQRQAKRYDYDLEDENGSR